MKNHTPTIAFVFMIYLLLCCTAHADTLRLNNTNMHPLQNKTDLLKISPPSGYYIIQLTGPVQEIWKTKLQNAGAKLFGYVPDFAFVSRIDAAHFADLSELDFVRSITKVSSEHIVSSRAWDHAAKSENPSFSIRVFDGEDSAAIRTAIADLGGKITNSGSINGDLFLEVNIPGNMLRNLSEIPEIRWIDTPISIKVNNDSSPKITGARAAGLNLGYYGEGQIVAVLDVGLCEGDINNLHSDFSDGDGGSRVLALVPAAFNTSGKLTDGASATAGHGTHVAGTVLGNGMMSGAEPTKNSFPSSCYAGYAPKASLVFQAACGSQTGCSVADFKNTYSQAYSLGARISTTSLGFDSQISVVLDEYLFSQKDHLAIISGGNSGMDANQDGIIDLGSIYADSYSKNVITVGASESYRSGEGVKWPDFGNPGGQSWCISEPILSDLRANCTNGVAAFSSRGPTPDGRYKPDILAPASSVVSTWYLPQDKLYYNMAGTSMASPQVAGAAALIREFLLKKHNISTPSSALIKAILLNSAKSMGDGQYGSEKYREIPSIPNSVCGWGLLNLRTAISPQPPFTVDYHDITSESVTTGYSRSFTFDIADSSDPLKANLVWTDKAGSELSYCKLVNDLDLMATSPSGHKYYPNNARLPLETSPFISYSSDGGSAAYSPGPYIPGRRLLVEIPALTSCAGVSKITIPLGAPLTVQTSVTLYFMEKLTDGTFIQLKAVSGTFSAGTTDLVFERYIPIPKDSGNTKYISIQTLNQAFEYKTTSDYPASNQRYYAIKTLSESRTEKTDALPFQVSIETFSYPDSQDFDRVNNSVGIIVNKPEKGRWTFTVDAYNVPEGPQPYALVISGLGKELTDGIQPIQSKPQNVPDTTILTQSHSETNQAELEATYNLSSLTPEAEKFDTTMTISPAAGQNSLASFKYPFTAKDDNKVSKYTLLKLKDDNSVLSFKYSDFAEFDDGNWWISDLSGNVLTSTDAVTKDNTYMINVVVLDNGNFDLNATENAVRDPSLLTVSASASSSSASTGQSAGCTISTGKVESWELLLLILAALGNMIVRKARK